MNSRSKQRIALLAAALLAAATASAAGKGGGGGGGPGLGSQGGFPQHTTGMERADEVQDRNMDRAPERLQERDRDRSGDGDQGKAKHKQKGASEAGGTIEPAHDRDRDREAADSAD